jgi:peroxiredoxin
MQRPAHDIDIGDRAPDFSLPGPDGKFYQFYERTRGGPVVMLFCPGHAAPEVAGFVKRHSDFAALGIDIFAITFDAPQDNAKRDLPFLAWSDPNRAITAHYLDGAGIANEKRNGVVAFLLDTNQRVLAIQCEDGDGRADAADMALAFYHRLPTPPPPQVVQSGAPVIIMPDLIDGGMCRDLMQLWETGGHEEGGVTSVVDDGEVHRVHTAIKKRRDHPIMDKTIHDALQMTLGRRIAPEVEKAFRFSGFGFDRFVVSCYDAARGDYFRPHRDNLSPENADRAFALTLNLNTDDYTGGELVFPEYGAQKYRPESGGGVIFSCSLIHEALPATTGRRFSLLTFLRLPRNAS